MSTVYITQEAKMRNPVTGVMENRLKLEDMYLYGKPIYLFPFGKLTMGFDSVVAILKERLRNFDDGDYLLPTGDPALMMAAAGVALEYNSGRAQVLRWDRKARDYDVIKLDLNGE